MLVGVWLLLKRSRLGMIIRAGVQDHQMVEALGINVRRVFTLVFALGVGLAALGGVLAAPSMGLSNAMGESLFLNALIAGLDYTVTALLIILIGGVGTLSGALIGTAVYHLLDFSLRRYIGESASFISGAIYMAIVLFLPYGIVGTWALKSFQLKQGWKRLIGLVKG